MNNDPRIKIIMDRYGYSEEQVKKIIKIGDELCSVTGERSGIQSLLNTMIGRLNKNVS